MINTIQLPPFKKMCVTIGNLPSSFMESMSYYEALCWLYNYLDNTVIPAINTEGEAITELQTAFVTLKTYVDNYFDNLDVQEEINNKLDAMAEAGTLTDIIAQYLGLAGVLAYNTVADMKLAENLVNGSTAKTLGYHSLNDGGGAFYKIRTITNNDIIDEASIISLYDNSLIAELIYDDNVNAKTFGAKGDDNADDALSFTKYINYCNANNKNIKINIGKYRIYSDLPYLNRDISIIGELGNNGVLRKPNYKTLILDYRTSSNYLINYNISSSGDSGNSIYNIGFSNMTDNQLKCINFNDGGYKSNLENLCFAKYLRAIYINSTHGTRLCNVNFIDCGSMVNNGNVYALEIENTTDVVMDHCMMEYCRFCVYTHNNANNFIMTNCYFELVTAIGIKGNEPLYISGGKITNNQFVTRPAATIASAISDTETNVYYMMFLLGSINLIDNTFTVGGSNDGNVDNNKKQGKYIKTNESGIMVITNNTFKYCSFDVPAFYFQSATMTFSDNIVNILTEIQIDSAYISKFVINDTGHIISINNIYDITSTSTTSNYNTYLPKFDRYNNMSYIIRSTYNSGSSFDTFYYKTIRKYSKTPTLIIQGTSGRFDLMIQNKGYLGNFYKGSITYNISDNNTTVTPTDSLKILTGSSVINFIKEGTKLIIQLTNNSNAELDFYVENYTDKIFAYNNNLDEYTAGIIHTISS